jgi:uncharacterized protein
MVSVTFEPRPATEGKMWRAIAIIFFLIVAGPAAAEETKSSIDCSAASSAAEKLICSDAQLSALDQVLADAYSDATRAGKIDKASQIEWLKQRDAGCAGDAFRECMVRRTELRIAALYAAAGSGPSFDCDAARSPAEFTICTEADLAQLDLVLAHAYRHALAAGKVDKASQIAWLKRRDIDCAVQPGQREDSQDNCLREHMQQRLAVLQAAYGFAYGTASCSPASATASVTFDIPRVPPNYLQAEYGTIFPDRLFSWRCDLSAQHSVTVKYGSADPKVLAAG